MLGPISNSNIFFELRLAQKKRAKRVVQIRKLATLTKSASLVNILHLHTERVCA